MLETTAARTIRHDKPLVSARAASRPDKMVDDLSQLHTRLREIGTRHTNRLLLLKALFDVQLRRPNVHACALVQREIDGSLALGPSSSRHASFDAELKASWITHVCQRAFDHGMEKVVHATHNNHDAICIPVRANGVGVLVTLCRNLPQPQCRATETAAAQLVITQLERWHDQRQLAELTDQLSGSSAIVELVQRIESASGLKSACFLVAATLKDHLRCERVFIGLRRNGHSCRIVAVSGVPEVDRQADESRRMKAVLDECLVRNELSAWPPLPDGTKTDRPSVPSQAGRHQLLAHKQLVSGESCVFSVPLKTPAGKSIGALAFVGRREMAATPQAARFVDALAEPLGSALTCVQRVEGSRLRRITRSVFARRHSKKRWLAAAVILACVAVMTVPTPYKIRCRSVTEPVTRRFCVAPHDGLLEGTFAEPGDMVNTGQLLARMDGREVRWELTGVTADAGRAAKKRDTHMARHETPDALLAELEMQRLDSRSKLLRFRQQNLAIASPIEGIVLSGSLDRRENYPVTKGQVLYEIAPLESLRVELSIPAEDVTHVRSGMSVELTFDGLGGDVFTGRMRGVRPRSEIRDDENVFVADVAIDNTDGRLRPGMMGRAKIIGERRSIGWIVFHRAWEKMQTTWPL